MLDYFALFLLCCSSLIVFYGIIAIHDIPYELAKSRNHPHQDAIHQAGWLSLFTLHVLWPFIWIWATLYREDRGWGFTDHKSPKDHIDRLESRLDELSNEVKQLQQSTTSPQPEIAAQSNNQSPVVGER